MKFALIVSLATVAFGWALSVSPAGAQGAKAAEKAAPMAAAADAKNIASDAYLQAFPLLQTAMELDRQMNKSDAPDYLGKFNVFKHQDGIPTPKDASIRRKSFDAPYSWAWLDLRTEPVVVQMPAIPAGRFEVAQFYDLWGHNLAHVDAKTAGAKPINRPRRRPGLEGCAAQRCRAGRAFGDLVGGRDGPHRGGDSGDGASVADLQKQFRILPLSQFTKGAAPKAAPPITFAAWDEAKADTGAFIGYVNQLLPYVRLDAAEQIAFKRYAGIGVVAGKPYDPAKMDSGVVAAIDSGVTEARGKLEKAMSEVRGAVDPVGTREAFGGDSMKRSISAGFDLHRVARNEIVEFPIAGDGGGDPFEKGAKYRLVFPPGQLPPVDGFWSLEMISVPNVRYFENPANRYVIDSRMAGLKKNADGSVEIAIQREIARAGTRIELAADRGYGILVDAAPVRTEGGGSRRAVEARVSESPALSISRGFRPRGDFPLGPAIQKPVVYFGSAKYASRVRLPLSSH